MNILTRMQRGLVLMKCMVVLGSTASADACAGQAERHWGYYTVQQAGITHGSLALCL